MGQQYQDPTCTANDILELAESEYNSLLLQNYDLSFYNSYSYDEQSIDVLQEIKDVIDDVSTRSLAWFEGLRDQLKQEEENATEGYSWLVLLIWWIIFLIHRFLLLN